MVYWKNKNGKLSVRSFNVSKYGEEGAKQLAIRPTGKHGGGGAAIAERSDCGRDKNADPRYR